jgi:hypothetical protein
MRTTLDIDDEVLAAAKEMARREHKTAGQVLSELARRALLQSGSAAEISPPASIHGFRPFASRGGVVTNVLIDQLRDETGN